MGIYSKTTRRQWSAWLLLLYALFLASGTAVARERKTLQKVSTAPADPQKRAADTWIDQTPGSTGTNHGSDPTLQVTSFKPLLGSSQNQRAIVELDLSSISSSGIKLATLKLFLSTAPSGLFSRTYQTNRLTGLWNESAVSWSNRLSGTAWGAAGGDVSGAATSTTSTGTTNGVFLRWDLTADVQRYFGATTPSANYGTMIRDQTEDNLLALTGVFSSKEDPTESHRPALIVEFIQNVLGLTATAGSAQVTLSWSYPSTIGTVLSATTGVLILRQAGSPVPDTAVPTDGMTPTRNTGCTNTVGGATVVFNSNSLPTSFNDSAAGDNPDCPPSNDTQYFYKVFTRDAANAYSANGTSSSFVPMITATPSATAANRQAATWMTPTGASTLAAPGIIPSGVVGIGSNSALIFGVKPADGTPVFAPVSTGGAINGQPPILLSTDASIGHDVIYSPNNDNFVYAIDAATGDILWMVNPTGLTTNSFTASASVVVKSFSTVSYTRSTDLVVVGTRNAGSTTANRIVGIDGNTGATVWQVIGNSGGNPNMDIVVSTPLIDSTNNAIWVTTHSNNGTAQPSIWKVDANTGARLATADLGNMSTWPTISIAADVLFAGTDAGVLFALNPANAATLSSFNDTDTKITGVPLVMSLSSPYTIIFSGATTVQAVIFNKSTNTFTSTGPGTWRTSTPAGCTPSSALGFSGLNKVYVGCSDGHIYQFDVATGTVDGSRVLDPNTTIGDLAMDLDLNIIMAGSTDGRIYAFKFPF